MKAHRPLLVTALLAGALLVPHAAAHSAVAPLTVSTVSHGIRLTLSVRHLQSPRNALILTHITVTDLAPAGVRIGPSMYGETYCQGPSPIVEVLDIARRVVFPPPLLADLGFSCPGTIVSSLPVLRPGRSERTAHLAIARGPLIRAAVWLYSGVTSSVEVHTPAIPLHLTAGTPPRTTIHGSPPDWARVEPEWSHPSPFFFQGVESCDQHADGIGVWAPLTPHGRPFRPSSGPHTFFLGCSGRPPIDWHIVAGWLGHPVAYVDYTLPAQAESRLRFPAPVTDATGHGAVPVKQILNRCDSLAMRHPYRHVSRTHWVEGYFDQVLSTGPGGPYREQGLLFERSVPGTGAALSPAFPNGLSVYRSHAPWIPQGWVEVHGRLDFFKCLLHADQWKRWNRRAEPRRNSVARR